MSQTTANRLAIPLILIITFCITFLCATRMFDKLAEQRGFYTEGGQADKELFE